MSGRRQHFMAPLPAFSGSYFPSAPTPVFSEPWRGWHRCPIFKSEHPALTVPSALISYEFLHWSSSTIHRSALFYGISKYFFISCNLFIYLWWGRAKTRLLGLYSKCLYWMRHFVGLNITYWKALWHYVHLESLYFSPAIKMAVKCSLLS